MVPFLREEFNSKFSTELYEKYLKDIWKWTNGEVDFRICETPLFLNNDITNKLIKASEAIVNFLQSSEFKINCVNAIPNNLTVPNEDKNPLFLQIDFAITRDEEGNFIPKLIELQGFPSLYMFQSELDRINRLFYTFDSKFKTYFNKYNYDSYLELFKKAVIGNHSKENVILLEIEPHKQKTRIDFYITNKLLGIDLVCVSEIIKKGNRLFYTKDGKEIEIERIYNRVIFDELNKKELVLNFDFRDDLDVEWAGHPNWFFKISKHSLPLIKNEFAPKCFYLSHLDKFPDNLNDYVLKPLYSFAGSGVTIDLSVDLLEKIHDRKNYILQEKIKYAPLIKTPDGYSMAEIRMMFLWIDKPILVNNLLRTSKGKMMGVDYNKGKTWVGSNIAYHSIN